MTGRGHPARGGGRSQSTDFSLDSRRGRGRPRKLPHATPLHLPAEMDQEMEEDFREVDEGVLLEGDEDEKLDLEKIKQLQHEKMMIVTPMAQKRVRGRPRQSTSNQPQLEEEMIEEEVVTTEIIPPPQENAEESGPLEAPGPSDRKPPTIIARSSRTRQTPKRLGDFVIQSTEKQTRPVPVPKTAPVPKPALESVPPIIPPPAAIEKKEEQMKPFVPNDARVEETKLKRDQEAQIRVQKDRKFADMTAPSEAVKRHYERLEESSHRPPPPPRHLVNKQNGRGRPANIIPPHRRPIPKDLMPPGTLKRVSLMREPSVAKRTKDTAQEQSADASSPASSSSTPSVAPILQPQLIPPHHHKVPSVSQLPSNLPPLIVPINDIKQEAPEAVNEVVIPESDGPPPMPPMLQQHIQQQQASGPTSAATSSSHGTEAGKKKEREAGKDLPSEHFPKEKARHVSTRGLIPFDSSKAPMIPYEQVILHAEDMGQEEDNGPAQQRVLTLQGGSFIEDRIGRADMMEDEEMKMMKSMQQQQYIQVQEDGVNVMYAVDPNDVIEDGEQVEMEDPNDGGVGQEEQYVMSRHQMQAKVEMVDEDDDDMPPQLVAEGVPEEDIGNDNNMQNGEEKEIPMDADGNYDLNMLDDGETIRLSSPGGHSHVVRITRDQHGNTMFIDEQGNYVELVTDTGAMVETSNMEQEQQEMVEERRENEKKKMMQPQVLVANGEGSSGQIGALQADRANANLEFSFLDTNNICCGLCGEIVLYEKLVSEHLPSAHPEYLSPGVELEEVPYDNWLKTRLKQEMKSMQNGFRHFDEHDGAGFGGAVRLYSKGLRQLRKVSQIRVNVNEMTMPQLEIALRRKLIEKMGRKVPVSLVDRLHARCDICQAIVSLNKKFEVVHLVRHFNAWHPAEHRCSLEWKDNHSNNPTSRRPLSLHDFAVVSTDTDQNNLQCIWCGMFMDRAALGMHFTEVHAQQVVVPNCSLCLQEMVMTARLLEKYGEDFGISLPDEFHLQSSKLDAKFSSEKSLDKAIDKHLKRAKAGNDNEDDDGNDDTEAICTTNSQQSFGRRNRLKRKFVKPCFRQICPTNSQFFEAKSACEWKCKLCLRNVYGAVISAGAIKHYKEFHPAEIDNMQYELVKARLERIGDGSMEFVHPQLVECLICNLTYALHKPFNICRAIRHLRLKHPEVMPETAGKPISGAEIAETTDLNKPVNKTEIRFGEMITDPIELERFRKDNFDQQFDKVQVVYGIKKNKEPAYILLMENEKMDLKTAQEMAEKVDSGDGEGHEGRFGQLIGDDEDEMHAEQDYEGTSEPAESALFRQEQKAQRMVLDFPEQIGEEGAEEMEIPAGTQYVSQYDANNPDHVLLDDGDIMNGENYEMIQEAEYQEMDDENRTVRYLTEEEIQEAQARGEFLEFAEEYVEEYAQQ